MTQRPSGEPVEIIIQFKPKVTKDQVERVLKDAKYERYTQISEMPMAVVVFALEGVVDTLIASLLLKDEVFSARRVSPIHHLGVGQEPSRL